MSIPETMVFTFITTSVIYTVVYTFLTYNRDATNAITFGIISGLILTTLSSVLPLGQNAIYDLGGGYVVNWVVLLLYVAVAVGVNHSIKKIKIPSETALMLNVALIAIFASLLAKAGVLSQFLGRIPRVIA